MFPAGPSSGKGVLQWARPEGNMRRPISDTDNSEESSSVEASQHPLGEDKDTAPSSETLIPEGKQARSSSPLDCSLLICYSMLGVCLFALTTSWQYWSGSVF